MADNVQLRVFETRTIINQDAFTGSLVRPFYVVSGSRMLVTLIVTSIDPATIVDIFADNNFTDDEPYTTAEQLTLNGVGRTSKVISDFHNLFNFRAVVTGGNASFKVGISLFDNAMTTRIDNAVIDVDLHHTLDNNGRFDSVRVGDGTNILSVEPDGSININRVASLELPDGAATEVKQIEGNALLTQIRDDVDGVEGLLTSIDSKVSTEAKQDTAIAILTSIRDNADQLEGYLDNVEPLLTAGNASLTSIDSNVSTAANQVVANGILADIDNNTDGLEALITSTNTLLTTIRDNADQLEGYLDNVEPLLSAGNASLSSIDTKVATSTNQSTLNTRVGDLTEATPASDTASSGLNGRLQRISQRLTTLIGVVATDTTLQSTNTKLDTVNTNLVTIEGKQDTGNASLSSIDGKVSTAAKQDSIITLLTTIRDNADQLEGYLDGVEGLITAGNSSLSSIDTKVATASKQDTQITSLQLIDDAINLQNTALDKGTPIMGQLDDTSTAAVTEDNVAAVRITSARAIHSNLRNVSGVELGTASTPIRVDPTGTTLQPVYLPLDSISSVINITVQDTASSSVAGYAGQALITGTPTANSTAAFVVASIQTVMIIVKGVWTGTLAIEISSDSGVTWVQRGIHIVGTGLFTASVTSNVVGSLNASAKTNVRVRATTAMTGAANINIVLSDNPSNVYVANAVKVIDGSGTNSTAQLAVKPASTAAIATDTSVVVALNPNTAVNLPTGAATSSNQTNGTHKSQTVDAGGDVAQVSAANGEQKVIDGMRNGGAYGALSIPTANTPVEAKVGGSRLSNRKTLIIVIESNGVFWGLDSSVTTSTGLPTANNQILTFAIDPDSTFQVWLVGSANSKNAHIAEMP